MARVSGQTVGHRLWLAATLVSAFAIVGAVSLGVWVRGPMLPASAQEPNRAGPNTWAEPTAGAATPESIADLPDVVWDLEYASATDTLWFVSGTGGSANLYRSRNDELTLVSSLPTGEYSGVHHKVRVLDSGLVLLNEDYGLVRYSPDSKQTDVLTFPLEAEGALPGSLDPGNPLPGTWVSAFAIDGDRVFVARNNVPYITVVDIASLEQQDRIDVGEKYAGAVGLVSLDGTLHVLARDGTIGQFAHGGGLGAEAALGASDVALASGEVIAADPVGRIFALGPRGFEHIFTAGWRPVLATAPGGFATYDPREGRVDTVAPTGNLMRRVQLPEHGLVMRGEQGASNTTAPPNLNDFVVSNDGSIWFVLGDGPTLWKVAP